MNPGATRTSPRSVASARDDAEPDLGDQSVLDGDPGCTVGREDPGGREDRHRYLRYMGDVNARTRTRLRQYVVRSPRSGLHRLRRSSRASGACRIARTHPAVGGALNAYALPRQQRLALERAGRRSRGPRPSRPRAALGAHAHRRPRRHRVADHRLVDAVAVRVGFEQQAQSAEHRRDHRDRRAAVLRIAVQHAVRRSLTRVDPRRRVARPLRERRRQPVRVAPAGRARRARRG